MHLRIWWLGLLLTAGTLASAQSASIQGRILDTLDQKPLPHAVVALLRTSDSTLLRFTRSDAQGAFRMDSLPPGLYLYQVSYPRFADYSDRIEVRPGSRNDLGTVPLTLKARLLDRVVIRNTAAIRVKGDTTEFVADSFKVREGATVEDLLKRFPGFSVNSKGEITAQGQRVGKVLVDGEEFFGDDPTMATQNISAKSVDKVQVYDTKTEEQQLTGISTGAEGKTVNIKLKESAKKGGFGKAHAASDFDRYVDAKLLYNRFLGRKKMSAYATRSKISTGGLDWEDQDKLGISPDLQYDEVGGFYTMMNDDMDFSDWSLQGLPNAYTAGGLYIDKWNAEKQSINLSYRYNRLGVRNNASTLTQNLLSSGITYQNLYRSSNSLMQRHAANATYQWKIDSFNTLKLVMSGSFRTGTSTNGIYSEYLGTSGEFRNRSNQSNEAESEKRDLQNALTHTLNFRKKKNRTLITTFRLGWINDEGSAITRTNTQFYNAANAVDSVDIADQMRLRNGNSTTMGIKTVWNEPLTSKIFMVLEYGYHYNQSNSNRETFNKTPTGKYDQLDPFFSNHFEFGAFSHSGKATWRYAGAKFRAALGSGMSTIRFRLFNLDSAKTTIYRFNNITPQANIGYQFRPQTSLNLSYQGATRQPTLEQLQPVRDNANRLNIFVGNPDLKVGFNHAFRLNYNSFRTLSRTYFMTGIQFNLPVNAITNYTRFDVARGKQVSTPVNVNGNYNWNIYSNRFKQGEPKKLSMGFFINSFGSRNNNFIDEFRNGTTARLRNTTKNYSFNGGPTLNISNEEKYSLHFNPTVGYNISQSSLRPETNTSYWSGGCRLDGFIQLPKKFQLNTEVQATLQQRLSAFGGASSPNRVLWQAELSRKVLKKDAGKISLQTNDLLNRNRGFDRNISTNFITENRYWRVGQYFLLRFEYSFTKTAGGE